MHRFRYIPLISLLATVSLHGQSSIGTGEVAKLYQQNCAACHGEDLRGGLGANLVDDTWMYGDDPESIASIIREGLPEDGMIAYKGVLSDQQILSLAIYLREMGQMAKAATAQSAPGVDGIFSSRHHSFRLEKVVGLENDIFWGVSFLPDGKILLTEFDGKLFVLSDDNLGEPVVGTPKVYRHGQGGLLEVMAHPDYARNGWIYLGFTDAVPEPDGGGESYMTHIVRGRIQNGEWVDQEDIWKAPARFYSGSSVHFGTRFVFDDGYLFFTVGDRGRMHESQDLTRPNGKVHRIHDDGRIPEDNPFVDQENAFPSIWSYGNRNIQGMDQHPVSGALYATEHGPRGGDELNLISKGRNYGWPVISYGINYNGQPITDRTAAPGMEQPVHYWTPSIAVCGIDFYEGDRFPGWKNDLFVGGLRSEHLERFRLKNGQVIEHEIVFKDQGRVRDVGTGPDGYLYVILNEDRNSGPGALYRLVPSE